VSSLADRLYLRPAAAYARSRLDARSRLGESVGGAPKAGEGRRGAPKATGPLQGAELVEEAQRRGVDLHAFKRTGGLPRVERALGALRGLQPASLLDLGSGRGVFLWPLLEAMPELPVTSVDLEAGRLARLQAVREGGLTQLRPVRADATDLPFAARTFDVVTALEVLEHIPEVWRAAAEVVRVARRFVLLSVPSRLDDNPGHLRCFTRRDLKELFAAAGAPRLRFEPVRGHLLAVASVGDR
jgi:hypothetical protein